MGFRKIYEVFCDECNGGIDYWEGTLKRVKEIVKDGGAVIKGDKCFCNEECYKEYKISSKKKQEE